MRNTKINLRIKELSDDFKKNKGVSLKKQAEELGVDPVTLRRIREGKTSCSADLIISAATYYDVSADYILGLIMYPLSFRQLSTICDLQMLFIEVNPDGRVGYHSDFDYDPLDFTMLLDMLSFCIFFCETNWFINVISGFELIISGELDVIRTLLAEEKTKTNESSIIQFLENEMNYIFENSYTLYPFCWLDKSKELIDSMICDSYDPNRIINARDSFLGTDIDQFVTRFKDSFMTEIKEINYDNKKKRIMQNICDTLIKQKKKEKDTQKIRIINKMIKQIKSSLK